MPAIPIERALASPTEGDSTVVVTSALNAAAASSARLYWHSLASSLASFDEVPVPSVYSCFPADNIGLSERWARTRFTDLRYYGTPARGGHFAAYEVPAEFVAEVRKGLSALTR